MYFPNNMNLNQKDKYFPINTFGVSAAEVLWGLGLPVIVESTFLQLFLNSLGASNKIIGLIPAILSAGIALFSLFSAYFTSHLVHKRRAVIITHFVTSFPFLILGIVFYNTGVTADTVTIFLGFYIAGALCVGLTMPVWQNFIMKIFSEKRTIPAIAIMFISQTCARLISSLIILHLVQKYEFSMRSSAIVFICVGITFFVGTFFFLFVKEICTDDDYSIKEAHNLKTIINAVAEIIRNRQFILYLISCIEIYTCITIISFYANYATIYYAIPKHLAAGLFLLFINGASILIYIFLGLLNIFKLKNKLVLSRVFALTAIIILLNANSLWGFLMASMFLGSSRATGILCFSPTIKKLSLVTDATDHFAVFQIIALPLSFGIPFLGGLFLDSFLYLGLFSYKILFGICAILIIISLCCILKIDFEKD